MVKISNRLKSLAKYIFSDDKVMDVGCDHALLDIYLVETGVISQIYVGDVNPNALQNGKDNIERHNLNANIHPILSYGIEKIGDLDVDTLIISGMGSHTIMEILSSPNLSKIFKLVLQSNTNWSDLRRFLSNQGFNIVREEIIEDGKKTYINIIAVRDYEKEQYTDKELEFGPKLITEKENLQYFEKLKLAQESIYYKSRSEEAKQKLTYLEEIIESLKNL